MPIPAAILAILQSVTASLIAKAPPAVHEKLSASRSLQRDLESAWNEARQTTLAENSAFDALVDQEKLSRVIFKQALDPYWLTGPENRQLELAVRTGWLGEPLAEKAATNFFVHFVERWKHKKSFAACAQWFEQLKGNELLEAIHEAIVSALEGVPVKAAPIPAPSATVLLQYCKRLAGGTTDPVVLARSVTERPPLEKGAAPPKPVPLEQVFAENDRIIILGEGGLGKTKALQHRERDLAEQYGRGAGCPVPVYVRLADYHGGEIENLVAERVNRVLTGSGKRLAETDEESARAARAWLEGDHGRVEILLDGLNEVPEDRVREFHTRLNSFLGFPQRFAFTSRDYNIERLPGHRIRAFLLAPLRPEEISELLFQKLGPAAEQLRLRLTSDARLAGLLSNPFMLDLIAGLAPLPGGTLPENRALLIRESVSRVQQALRLEGPIAGPANRSGVIEEFLKALAWKMLRTGVVSAHYSSVYAWNLPTSGFDLGEVLGGASAFRLLRSAAEEGTPIEFRHPLFRDYFAAERTAAIVEQGSDLNQATEGQYAVPDWREALLMTAGLRGPKAGEMVKWLITKECLDLAFDCWADSEARNDWSVTTTLAASLRVVTASNIEFADCLITQLGELQDPKAVPLIVQFMAEVGSWAHFEAIPALEKIRTEEALAALVQALDGKDEDTKRDAWAALLRIGSDAIPALLSSGSDAAETIRGKLAPHAVDELTCALKDPDAIIRARAVLALGMSGYADAAGAIIRLLQTDQTRVRTEAVRALGRLRNAVAAPALVKALEDENVGVRFEAASPLWEHDWAASAAKAALLEMYESMSKYPSWKTMVLNCLMTRPDEQIVAMVLEASRDRNEEVRYGAFSLLDRVSANIDAVLADGLRDSSPKVRVRAAGTLVDRHSEGALRWLTEAFEENPSERSPLLDLIDPTFGEAGTKYLLRVLDSGMNQMIRATAAKKLSEREDRDSEVAAALGRSLRMADPAKEPILVSELIMGLRDSKDPAVLARVKSLAEDREDKTVEEKVRTCAQRIVSHMTRPDA